MSVRSETNVDLGVVDRLKSVVGDAYVLTDEHNRDFYSRDLSYLPYETASVVVQPGSVEELAAAVRESTTAGFAVVPRGGGMSYTKGYTPDRAATVSVDMRRMSRILEINTEDMYVTVECGCTWKSLYEALKAKGVRTPYYGPLSGMFATVGGAISQNSLFLGSGVYNTVAESVLGLEVVLADGSLLRTGSGAHKNSNGFYRHFGPDVTGIFTTDTGAFAFKATATLRLVTFPKVTGAMSFAFDTIDPMLHAQTEVSRLRIAAECYGFDPYYNAGFERLGFTFKQGISTLAGVARKRGLWQAFKVAKSGQKVLSGVRYSLHLTFEGHTPAVAAEHMEIAREICLRHGGTEIDNSIPTAFNAAPFDGVSTVILGSDGEIWLPIHCFIPLSKAREMGRLIEKYFADNRALMEKHRIRTSYLTCFSGTEFVIEPSFYWYDEVQQFRLEKLDPKFREKWSGRQPDKAARDVALGLRDGLRQLFFDHGACHLQIGRYYPFREAMNNDGLWSLLDAIKSHLDPQRLVNPGSLGMR